MCKCGLEIHPGVPCEEFLCDTCGQSGHKNNACLEKMRTQTTEEKKDTDEFLNNYFKPFNNKTDQPTAVKSSDLVGLRPCPFCTTKRLHLHEWIDGALVRCECGGKGPPGFGPTAKIMAYDLWNKHNTGMDDLPLITNRHYNKAINMLGKVHRVKLIRGKEYPEIGCIEVNNAVGVVANLLAEVEFLKKKI